jgi:hypothetical protein
MKEYSVCTKKTKHKMSSTWGYYKLFPLLTHFNDISMDFIEGLPKCNGKNVIYVVVRE